MNKKMNSKDVVDIYNKLENLGIKIWIDGGWSVDALLGKQTRPHNDLDIAIQWQDVPKFRKLLQAEGYKQIEEDGEWNFVLKNDKGCEIDVHAFVYDKEGNIVEGIMYPTASLSGTGTLNSHSVRCISPEYMVKFLAQWVHKHPHKYLDAIYSLCKKFRIEYPKEYIAIKNNPN